MLSEAALTEEQPQTTKTPKTPVNTSFNSLSRRVTYILVKIIAPRHLLGILFLANSY